MLRRFPLFFALLFSAPLHGETVTSPVPDTVSVTVYRDPGRDADTALDKDWLGGYALITEQRRIRIPAGENVIRFEGVAGGIIAESAIVTGLPDGVIEKNQDANLLSPYALVSGSTGRRVTIKRTSKATGVVTEETALLRSGGDGGLVLQTKAGFEALQCSGQAETLLYDQMPDGLSAKPTLSVRTVSKEETQVVITLSYLARGFDWQANYVAHVAENGKSLDLFAWVTLANSDPTSFANADTQVVAGKPNREVDPEPPESGPNYVTLNCWPSGTTTNGLRTIVPPPPPPPPPPPLSAPAMMMARESAAQDQDSIIVTASRIVRQEELGDLKLYRIPQPVTVASNSQKQVALLNKAAVPVEIIYRSDGRQGEINEPRILLRLQNKNTSGLGLALPAGKVAIFHPVNGRPLLVGEGSTEDKAVGEEVEIEFGDASNVTVETEYLDSKNRWEENQLTVRNANDFEIRYEVRIALDDGNRITGKGSKLTQKDGRWLWAVTIPANGNRVLRYKITEPK